MLGAIVLGLLFSAATAEWLPKGSGGVDHVVVATVVAPLWMTALAIYLIRARATRRAWLLTTALAVLALAPAWLRWAGIAP